MADNRETVISRVLDPDWAKNYSVYLADHTSLGPGSSKKYLAIVRSLLGKENKFSLDLAARFSKQRNRQYARAAIVKLIDYMVYIGTLTEQEAAFMVRAIPTVKEAPAKPRKLAKEAEIIQSIGLMEKEYRLIGNFLLYTGCRVHEALSIKLKDIDFETGTIIVYGKGRIKKKPRPVRISMEYLGKLRGYLESLGILEGEYVFLTESRASLESKVDMFNQKFRKACMQALGRSLGSHEFRRYVGTKIYTETRDLQLTQRILGHEKITTTQVYTKYADIEKDLDTARDILSKKKDK